ncbi:DEAD/DEAH box helicase [Aquibacillus salsiterrae]|uniref:DEAD/DEAH box helicase n=1 Tax=Aquibacillus salsiterrae TaxID=2950439 RepID=A0A9X4AGL7_9BACI|nr:DEAD/DEAH box helicase [Aquibacillus salsiterrae]MDC3417415.1 DEAD/DEAH box helicase [Aquibacillus salsiterrae]
MTIHLEDIRNHFDEVFFRRGQSYFKQGRVKDLHYNSDDRTWQGKVVGTETYNVIVTDDEARINYNCNCMAIYQYGECKHVVACLLAIENKLKANPFLANSYLQEKNHEAINYFVNAFSSLQQTDAYHRQELVQKQQLQAEFIIKTQSQYIKPSLWTIEMKIGPKRTYVVKDLRGFLSAVDQRKSYFFTNSFSYDPTEHAISASDMAVMTMLHSMAMNELAYTGSNFQKDNREVIIPPMLVDDLLANLQNTNYSFHEISKGVFPRIPLMGSEPPFTFKLDKGAADDFYFDATELMEATMFEAYRYVLVNGALYKLTADQQSILQELENGLVRSSARFSERKSISINKEQMESFLSIVIPHLRKVGSLEITDEVSNQIRQYPLEAKMYVDREEDTLQVEVEYHYGDIKINPFQQDIAEVTEQNQLIIRDAMREQEIMTAIEHASLKYNGKKLYVDGEDEIYFFLFHTLPYLEQKVDIFLTSQAKGFLLPESQTPETTFDFNPDGGFLNVSFDMKDIDPEQIQQVLQSVVEKRKYYRLPSGAFVAIEGNEQFEQIGKLYTDLNISKADIVDQTMQLPAYRALQVEDILNEGSKHRVRLGKQFRRLIQQLRNPDQLDFNIPEQLQAELRDYQEVGFQWLSTLAHYSLGGILADDMGLGKTLQSIAFLLAERERQSEQERKSALIVAPASLVYNWQAEFEKFAPSLHVEVVIGTPTERQAILSKEVMPDVWITSYPTLRQDIDWYKEHQFSTYFLDEAQAIKNAATKTSKAVRSIKANKRFALSGTPIENSLDELWAIFQAILPGFFPAQATFRKLDEGKISRMARPFILRRLKKDVLTELPDKIETTNISELTNEQKGLYIGYLERIQQETKESLDSNGLNKSRIKILAGLTRLRQLCCHPSLFIDNYQGTSGKLEQLKEIVLNAKENEKRMLIFSQFTSMLHIIREELLKEGIDFFYIDGQTPSKERLEMVNRFNQGEKDVFLISLKAGGTGLNLTGADTVILYDLWWNPAIEEQAAGRAHRMGQKNVVQVIRLLTKGTIEEKIYQLQQRKKELIEKVIQPGEEMLSSITEDEIREILSI